MDKVDINTLTASELRNYLKKAEQRELLEIQLANTEEKINKLFIKFAKASYVYSKELSYSKNLTNICFGKIQSVELKPNLASPGDYHLIIKFKQIYFINNRDTTYVFQNYESYTMASINTRSDTFTVLSFLEYEKLVNEYDNLKKAFDINKFLL